MKTLFFTGKTADFEKAAMIRQAVFVEEQKFHNEFDELDAQCLHCVLEDQHGPAAVCRAYPKVNTPDCWIIGRVAVVKAYRGQHLGEQLMNEMIGELRSRGVQEIELSAQCRAAGFYEKLGFISTGEEHLDEYCPHVTMILKLNP